MRALKILDDGAYEASGSGLLLLISIRIGMGQPRVHPPGVRHDPFLAAMSKNGGGVTALLRDEVFGRFKRPEGHQNPLALNHDERALPQL